MQCDRDGRNSFDLAVRGVRSCQRQHNNRHFHHDHDRCRTSEGNADVARFQHHLRRCRCALADLVLPVLETESRICRGSTRKKRNDCQTAFINKRQGYRIPQRGFSLSRHRTVDPKGHFVRDRTKSKAGNSGRKRSWQDNAHQTYDAALRSRRRFDRNGRSRPARLRLGGSSIRHECGISGLRQIRRFSRGKRWLGRHQSPRGP